MTVRLLRPFNGYPIGAVVSLGAATETALVNTYGASYDLTGGVAYAPNDPFDLSTSVVGLSSNPSSNTAAIQRALDRGGNVILDTPGVYEINSTLVIGSNTRLELSPGVEIKLANHSNVNMLVSKGYRRTSTSITGAWSAGLVFTISWQSHGFSVGDYVWLSDFAPSRFNGVFSVATVTDSNTFTVLLNRIGVALSDSSGSGRAADVNVEVVGGMWDYNNQTGVGDQRAHAIILGVVYNLRVKNVSGKNATKYVLNIGAVDNFVVDGLIFDGTPSDGLKLYGPATNGAIYNVGGVVGDDMISFQTREPDAFAAFRWTFGDITNVKASNLFGSHSAGVGRLMVLYGSPNEIMDVIDLSEISGATTVVGACPITLTAGTGLTGVFGSVSVRNVRCDSVEAIIFAETATYGRLIIDGVTGQGDKAFQTASTLTVGNLSVRNVSVDITDSAVDSTIVLNGGTFGLVSIEDGVDTETGAQYYVSCANATIDTLSIEGIDVTGGSSRRFCNIASGTVSHVRLIGNNTGNLSNFFVLSSGVSGNPLIEAYGNQCDGAAGMAFLNISASCKVAVGGNQCVNAGNGFIRTGGTPTIQIRSAGDNILSAGTWIVVPSGTPVLTVYGYDFTFDPIALTGLATTNGQFITSSQAGVEGGPAVRTPAGWVALGTGAAGINTVIT